jgi:ubiquinone/menaquinone biosynthesis C-methylase UbiE
MPQVEDWTHYYQQEAGERRFLPDLDPSEKQRTAFAQMMLPPGPLGRTLDVGAGDGWLASVLSRRDGTEVTILDLVAERAGRAVRRTAGPGVVARAESLPFADATFDTVVMVEVLEHVIDLAVVLAEARRIALGGRLLITVPFEQKIPWVICPSCLERFPVDGHLHSFSVQSLRAILEENGLSPSEIRVHKQECVRRWQQIPPLRWLGPQAAGVVKRKLEEWRILDAPPGRFIGALVDPVK